MNLKLAEQIMEMARIDQASRFNTKSNKGINFFVYTIDKIHHLDILSIIARYGYPTKKLIGEKALKAFWLLIQHQDSDVVLQKQCLRNCNFDLKEKAYLTDRICINTGKKQIYGTQYKRLGKKRVLAPTIDPSHVNEKRKKIGLDPIKISFL